MSEKTKAIDAFERLIKEAHLRNIVGSTDYEMIQKHIREGGEIPYRLLPGRLLDKLTEEEREQLKKLKSEWVTKRRYG